MMQLDPEVLTLIQSGDVATYVATADAARRPHVARALSCRPETEGSALITWVSKPAAEAVLDDVASNARLAFTVSHVQSCRSLQLKAVDAQILEADSADYARISTYQDGFVRKTASVGYDEAVMRRTVQVRLADLIAIRFTPGPLFMQTPGPGAGSQIK
ncbi:MAG TPA: hypothetical protein VLD39_05005 [Gammaproteobacteria bacterium]|nr:hypothetical protein [Gammaproteobacteria bacterium]